LPKFFAVIDGVMRGYLLQGLNWMVSLHHNGLNSILADEMVRMSFHPSKSILLDPGKTLYTVPSLAYLKHHLVTAILESTPKTEHVHLNNGLQT